MDNVSIKNIEIVGSIKNSSVNTSYKKYDDIEKILKEDRESVLRIIMSELHSFKSEIYDLIESENLKKRP